MKRRLSVVLAMATLLCAQSPASAAEASVGQGQNRRPFVQFLHRSTFFGLNPIDIPIDPKSNRITDTVRLVGGELDGTVWQVTGDGSVFSLVRKAYTFGGSNHPNPNIVGLFSSSARASEELRLADEAASREETYMAWAYGFAVAAAIPLALAASDRSQSVTSSPLFYTGVGLGVAGVAPAIMGGLARRESWNHLGWAVKAWNLGQ